LINHRSLLLAIACSFAFFPPVFADVSETSASSSPANTESSFSPAKLLQAQQAVPGLFVVSPELVRGAQPKSGGLAQLKDAGVKTIINLMHEDGNTEREEAEAKGLGLNYIAMPLSHFKTVPQDVIDGFLATVSDPRMQPVFVHCNQGMDRTGTLVAIYRINNQQWSANKSYDEMLEHGFHSIFGNLTKSVYAHAAKLGSVEKAPSSLLGAMQNPFKRYKGSPLLSDREVESPIVQGNRDASAANKTN
jgi:protein tyrosine/serine phosphatase